MKTELTTQLTEMLNQLHRNAWTIVFVIFGGFFCWNNCEVLLISSITFMLHKRQKLIDLRIPVIAPYIDEFKVRQSYRSATDPHRVSVLSPDMKRIRDEQQRIAHENAIKAEQERKVKSQKEKERKRVKTPEEERWERLGGGGNRLGGSADVGVKKTR